MACSRQYDRSIVLDADRAPKKVRPPEHHLVMSSAFLHLHFAAPAEPCVVAADAGIRRASPGRHILGSPDLHAPLHAASGLCMLTICSHEVAAGAASTGSGSLVTDHSPCRGTPQRFARAPGGFTVVDVCRVVYRKEYMTRAYYLAAASDTKETQ